MSNIRAIMTAVNYHDLLSLSIPWNRHHFSEVTIVTTPADYANVFPIAVANDAQVLTTDLFYHAGARFNKFLAMEWGLSQIGRRGWLCIMDADVLWPKVLPTPLERILHVGYLYTPLRRMYPHIPRNASEIPPEDRWRDYPIHRNINEWAGYSQLFSADDPVLGRQPWHQVDWTHAGGADSFFQAKWPQERKVRPDWHVLHLGIAGENWAGRVTPYANGEIPPNAQERRDRVARIWQQRRGKRGMEAFRDERYSDDVDLPPL